MLTPVERVELLLRTLNEARVSYGEPSTGTGSSIMPSTYNAGSYQELERCLVVLRESPYRNLWWHASSRYRWGETQTMICRVERRKNRPDIFQLPPYCELIAGGPAIGSKSALVRVYHWSDDVDEKRAHAGLRALTRLMYDGDRGRIKLPLPLLYRTLGLPLREKVA